MSPGDTRIYLVDKQGGSIGISTFVPSRSGVRILCGTPMKKYCMQNATSIAKYVFVSDLEIQITSEYPNTCGL